MTVSASPRLTTLYVCCSLHHFLADFSSLVDTLIYHTLICQRVWSLRSSSVSAVLLWTTISWSFGFKVLVPLSFSEIDARWLIRFSLLFVSHTKCFLLFQTNPITWNRSHYEGSEAPAAGWAEAPLHQTACLLWSLAWVFFPQLFLPFGACQEMLAECCSATCDTSAVIAVTSLSPEQDVMLVKFMQLPAAFDTHSWWMSEMWQVYTGILSS